jgi:hypothetical protein
VVGGSVIGASVTTGVAVSGAEESMMESAEFDPPPQLTATAIVAAPRTILLKPMVDISNLPDPATVGVSSEYVRSR